MLFGMPKQERNLLEYAGDDGSGVWLPGFWAVKDFLESPLQVCGYCMLSIFDGTGAMSLGMTLTGVPTICPWEYDVDGRLDVLKNYAVLWRLALSGRVGFSWLATPCRSWTMARSPMLRSWVEIFGCAWVILTGSPEQQRLVREGNALTWLQLCTSCVSWRLDGTLRWRIL